MTNKLKALNFFDNSKLNDFPSDAMKAKDFKEKGFNEYQIEQLNKGIKSNIDISIYSSVAYDEYKMCLIRLGLEFGLDLKGKINSNQTCLEIIETMKQLCLDGNLPFTKLESQINKSIVSEYFWLSDFKLIRFLVSRNYLPSFCLDSYTIKINGYKYERNDKYYKHLEFIILSGYDEKVFYYDVDSSYRCIFIKDDLFRCSKPSEIDAICKIIDDIYLGYSNKNSLRIKRCENIDELKCNPYSYFQSEDFKKKNNMQ